jgi:hypothetical protein
MCCAQRDCATASSVTTRIGTRKCRIGSGKAVLNVDVTVFEVLEHAIAEAIELLLLEGMVDFAPPRTPSTRARGRSNLSLARGPCTVRCLQRGARGARRFLRCRGSRVHRASPVVRFQ